jgi:hypothetical protein
VAVVHVALPLAHEVRNDPFGYIEKLPCLHRRRKIAVESPFFTVTNPSQNLIR